MTGECYQSQRFLATLKPGTHYSWKFRNSRKATTKSNSEGGGRTRCTCKSRPLSTSHWSTRFAREFRHAWRYNYRRTTQIHMTARQQAQLVLAKGSIPGSVAFSQGFLRVRHKYTLRTEEDIAAYVRRIQSAIPGLELDNAFLNQKEFPFPSAIELWFRLSGEASRLLGTSPTPHAAEAPLVSPVGRIYRVGKRRRVHENVSGQERGSTVMAMPQGTEELETM